MVISVRDYRVKFLVDRRGTYLMRACFKGHVDEIIHSEYSFHFMTFSYIQDYLLSLKLTFYTHRRPSCCYSCQSIFYLNKFSRRTVDQI